MRSEFSYLSGKSDVATYASSDTHLRLFCKICGSNILVELEAEPESLYLAMGTVDGDPERPPGYHIFVGSKAPWYTFEDESARYETFPEDE